MKNSVYRMAAAALLATIVALTACQKKNEEYVIPVTLQSFGPCPVARGGEMVLIGKNMDLVTQVTFPENVPAANFEVVSDRMIRLTVPDGATVGKLTLVGDGFTLESQYDVSYIEPMVFTSFSPTTIKPGETLTIEGELLNLIKRVLFTGAVVTSDDFTTWEADRIQLAVPMTAQTGTIILSDGGAVPQTLTSATALTVVLPSVAAIIELSEKSPGDEITIAVTNIDLVDQVELPDGTTVEFTVEGNTLIFTLPEGATDGEINMVSFSGIRIPIANLTMVPEPEEEEEEEEEE